MASTPTVLEPVASPVVDAPAIAISGLTVAYGRRTVLHGIDAELRGRVIGLLGPNGAGKSTLINTLLGFVRPTAGRVRILGLDAGMGVRRQRSALRALTGYMPENDAFIANLTAVSFVRLMAELSGLPPEAALERAHEALFYVGLGEARYRKLGGFSLGMKQMAKLAQAIVHGPRLLILDEPTNSLDPPARARMLHLIGEIRDTGKVTILMCSHLLRDVEETCDEVVILKQGRIVHHANLAEERRTSQEMGQRWLDLETGIEAKGATDGAHPDFMAALGGLGCELTPGRNGSVRLTLPPGTDGAALIRQIYQIAAAHALPIHRLSFRRDTLEDIFLRAMHGDDGAGTS
ncbi:MAG TPA: ABC transporter ATP-binding protein [Terriglobales bacterium]